MNSDLDTTRDADVRQSYETLLARVFAVARKHCRVAVTDGASRAVLALLVPLLLTLAVDRWLGLHYVPRAAVVIAILAAMAYYLTRHCLLPWLKRYTMTEAAMLVEQGLPELNGRVVSALEVIDDLDRDRPRFDRDMVRALIHYAQDSTRDEDFGRVVETRRMRRNTTLAVACVALTVVLAVAVPGAFGELFERFLSAFSEVGQFAQKIAGASIEVEPGDNTILRGDSLRLVGSQRGFRSDQMRLHIRKEGNDSDTVEMLRTDASGVAQMRLTGLDVGFSYYFAAQKVRSAQYAIKVTERPRIVNMRIEYEFPRYVRRAPMVVGRSDGRIEALYGSIAIVTIESNKPLSSAEMTLSYKPDRQESQTLAMSLGGRFARAIIKLDNTAWLAAREASISETYRIRLKCEDGYDSPDSDVPYQIVVKKDRPPDIRFVRLLNRSPEHEVHVLDSDASNIGFYVDARDDYGLRQITFHYRIEDLMSNEVRTEDTKKRVFQMPQSEFSAGLLLRLGELQPEIGDRIAFWAEAEDAYDLEEEKGPNTARTPEYRIAVVTREELFEEVLYSDDWSTTWYDPLKVATLSRRAIPPRTSPTNEPLAMVAELLLKQSPHSDRVSMEHRRMVEHYFNTINIER